jgi:hypothetical protein
MNTQNLIVGILVVLCIAYIVYRSYRKKKDKDPCANCPTGCELHDMIQEKQKTCKRNKKNAEK